jgi:hypothetical protein
MHWKKRKLIPLIVATLIFGAATFSTLRGFFQHENEFRWSSADHATLIIPDTVRSAKFGVSAKYPTGTNAQTTTGTR